MFEGEEKTIKKKTSWGLKKNGKRKKTCPETAERPSGAPESRKQQKKRRKIALPLNIPRPRIAKEGTALLREAGRNEEGISEESQSPVAKCYQR